MPAHVGSTDVDVVVGVTLDDADAEAYRTLQQNLREANFGPSRNPDTGATETFRWERKVDGITVKLEFFCPVAASGAAGRLRRNPGDGIGSTISAIQLRGADLAALDHRIVLLSGDTLDHGGIREGVELRVANVLPFLVLKAFALAERDKPKDPYDIVWLLTAYGGGPDDVARAAAESPVLDRPEVIDALGLLRRGFATPEHAGPSRYAGFVMAEARRSPGQYPDEFARLQRDAHAVMREFLGAWGRTGLPDG